MSLEASKKVKVRTGSTLVFSQNYININSMTPVLNPINADGSHFHSYTIKQVTIIQIICLVPVYPQSPDFLKLCSLGFQRPP